MSVILQLSRPCKAMGDIIAERKAHHAVVSILRDETDDRCTMAAATISFLAQNKTAARDMVEELGVADLLAERLQLGVFSDDVVVESIAAVAAFAEWPEHRTLFGAKTMTVLCDLLLCGACWKRRRC
jgi:hypothetical protein